MGNQATDLVKQIRSRLLGVLNRITLAQVISGFSLVLTIGLGLWLSFTWIEAGFWLGSTVRLIFLLVFLSSVLATIGWFVIRPIGKRRAWWNPLSEYEAADRVGKHFPHIQDRITNILELSDSRNDKSPDPFVDRAVLNLGKEIEGTDFDQIENFKAPKKLLRFAAIPISLFLLSSILAPGPFFSASARLFQPMEEFLKPASFSVLVQPGDIEVLYGDPLNLVFKASGLEIPNYGILSYQFEDEEVVQQINLEADSSKSFSYHFDQVRRPFAFAMDLGDVSTKTYEVSVIRRPSIRKMLVELDYPAYTRIPRRKLESNVGDFIAMPGSKASFDLDLGPEPVTKAFLAFEDGSRQELALEGDKAKGVLTVSKAGTYQVILESAKGTRNTNPIAYEIKIRPDQSPNVMILEPDGDSDLADNMTTVLRARILDDFGFSDLRLHFRQSEAAYSEATLEFSSIPLNLANKSQLDQEVLHFWSVQEALGIELLPGDVIEYFLEVMDNDRFRGAKSSRSSIQVLRVPSLSEQFDEMEEAENEVQTDLEEMLKNAEDIKDEFSELRDELRKKQESDWDDERQVEKLKNQQDAQQQQMNEISEQMKDMVQEMSENNTVSPQTQQTFEELQKVMEEINSPEMMEALEKLQEAMQNMDLQKMQQAIENFEFNEEQYRKRMERTLEMLKRFRAEQSLEEAAKRAEELAEKEEKISEATQDLMEQEEKPSDAGQEPKDSEGTENQKGEQSESSQDSPQSQTKSPEELAKEQLQAKEEMEKLEQLMEEIQEQLGNMENAPSDQMEQMSEQMEQQDLPSQMQQNAEQMQQGEMKEAQKGQQNMQQQLQQMSSELSQMGEQMSMEQMNINIAALRRVLDDVLTLSKDQEALRKDLTSVRSENPAVRALAKKQVDLSDGLKVVADTLQKLSADIAQMSSKVQSTSGEALRDMTNSISEMSERRITQATGHQKSSMKNLNDLALMLSDLMGQLQDMMQNQGMNQNPGMSGQQFSQMLNEMAQKQAQMNQQMDAMMNDMMGNRISQSKQSRMKQLREQQQQLMEQLQNAMQNGGKENLDKVLGDLNKIAEQMRESLKDLQQNTVTRQTRDRQNEILSRLLQAQQSLRERGKENKREGKSAEEYQKKNPSALPPNERAEKLRRDLIRALENGYSSDYEEIIKRYFEALQNGSGLN